MVHGERLEALALSFVARGEGTHSVEGNPEISQATVQFSAGSPDVVVVRFRGAEAPPREFRFRIGASSAAPTTSQKPVNEGGTADEIARLHKATEDNPEDPGCWNDLGSHLLELGRVKEAIQPLEKALDLIPGNAYFALELGMAYGSAGRHGDAESLLSKVSAADPKLEHWASHPAVVALIKLAQARWKLGKAADALETLRPAIPLAASILRDLGAYAMDAGKHHEAVMFLAAAGSVAPDMEDALHCAGRSLLWLGRTEEAVPWLKKAVAADAACIEAWYDLGLALSRLGKRSQARRMFRRALKLDPNHASSWYDLGCQDALDRKTTAAFRNLHRAARSGWNRVAHAQADPDLVEIRKDGRWRALVAAMQQASSNRKTAAPPA